MINNLKIFIMREKVNFISKSLGIILIWDDQIKNFQIIEDSSVWNIYHRKMFQDRINYWRSEIHNSNHSYKCKQFEIHYNFDTEGFLTITDIKF